MSASKILEIVVIGILTIVIGMQLIVGTNQVGWNAGVANMMNVIIPMVIGVGIVLLILAAALGRGNRKSL
jgi:hypothetical protein